MKDGVWSQPLTSSCVTHLGKLVHLYCSLGFCFPFLESHSRSPCAFSSQAVLDDPVPLRCSHLCEILTQAETTSFFSSFKSTVIWLSVFHPSFTHPAAPAHRELSVLWTSNPSPSTLGEKNPTGQTTPLTSSTSRAGQAHCVCWVKLSRHHVLAASPLPRSRTAQVQGSGREGVSTVTEQLEKTLVFQQGDLCRKTKRRGRERSGGREGPMSLFHVSPWPLVTIHTISNAGGLCSNVDQLQHAQCKETNQPVTGNIRKEMDSWLNYPSHESCYSCQLQGGSTL